MKSLALVDAVYGIHPLALHNKFPVDMGELETISFTRIDKTHHSVHFPIRTHKYL